MFAAEIARSQEKLPLNSGRLCGEYVSLTISNIEMEGRAGWRLVLENRGKHLRNKRNKESSKGVSYLRRSCVSLHPASPRSYTSRAVVASCCLANPQDERT